MSDDLKKLIKEARDEYNIPKVGDNDKPINGKFTDQLRLFENEHDNNFANWKKRWFSNIRDTDVFYKNLESNIEKNK